MGLENKISNLFINRFLVSCGTGVCSTPVTCIQPNGSAKLTSSLNDTEYSFVFKHLSRIDFRNGDGTVKKSPVQTGCNHIGFGGDSVAGLIHRFANGN